MIREGRVFISVATDPDFGVSYSIQALEVGAQVTSTSSGTTITVRTGHGFAAGDKVMRGTDVTTFSATNVVASVTATTVVMNSAYSVSAGDFLVNLAVDSSTSATPNYDGAGLTVYTTMDYTTTAENNTVTSDSTGRYRYFHKGIARWELVRVGSTLIALYMDTGNPADEDQVAYQVRYAHLFAASGTGTLADPWPGAAILAARNDLPAGVNGKVKMVSGVFDLGSGSIGLNLDVNTVYSTGFVLEGAGGGNEETATVGPQYANDGATTLLYSGTGEAIRIGDFSTSSSQWLENAKLIGFKVRQMGAVGTGIGILARLFRWGVFEDITCCDFAVGLALASVSDFNLIERFRIRDCHTYGIDIGRTTTASGAALGGTNGQCNGNRLLGCDIVNSVRNSGFTNYGVFIHGNSVGTRILGGGNYGNFDTTGSAAIFINDTSVSSPSTTVTDTYFEGNYSAVTQNNPFAAGTDQSGLTVRDNFITQIVGYGVLVNSGSTGLMDGVVITGNHFAIPSTASPYNAAKGIQLGTYIQNAFVFGNHFEVANLAGTLPGGNIIFVSGVSTHNNLLIGTSRFFGAQRFDSAITMASTLAVTGATTLTGGVTGAMAATGAVSGTTITGSGNMTTSSGLVGYATGAGGTVTQATSKATQVTLSKSSGQITLNNSALNAETIVSFVCINTLLAATDILVLNHVSGGTPGSYSLNARAASGSATIDVRNDTAGSLSEAIVIGFAVVKGATS